MAFDALSGSTVSSVSVVAHALVVAVQRRVVLALYALVRSST